MEEIKRGQVIWAENISAYGRVQNSARPYVVLSNDVCNSVSPIITAIPLTASRIKTCLPTHYKFFMNNRWNIALCEQITCLDVQLFGKVVGVLSEKDMSEIEKRVKLQLDLKGFV